MQIKALVSKANNKKKKVNHAFFLKSATRKIAGSQYGSSIYIYWLKLRGAGNRNTECTRWHWDLLIFSVYEPRYSPCCYRIRRSSIYFYTQRRVCNDYHKDVATNIQIANRMSNKNIIERHFVKPMKKECNHNTLSGLTIRRMSLLSNV